MSKSKKQIEHERRGGYIPVKDNGIEYKGNTIFKSLSAGRNSSYSYSDSNGNKSAYGFDSPGDVKSHIDNNTNWMARYTQDED